MEEPQQLRQVAELQAELERGLRRRSLAGRGILVAVSGGADSLVLMHALKACSPRLDLRLEVATVDHGLQPQSATWADGVERAATQLSLRCHRATLQLDPTSSGVEAKARDARYAALERIRRQAGLDVVATAHTASDQAETLVMRLARGTALGGAAGILEEREDRVVRPLLFATRADVERWAEALGLSPVSDPMNGDPAFLRARIRREVLPAWSAAVGFEVQPALARFARLAAEDDRYLSEEARRAFERCALSTGGLDRVAVAALAIPVRRRVVAEVLSSAELPLDTVVLEEALRAVAEGGTATLPGDKLLACTNDRVRVEPAPPRRTS
ncbi:MAG: tRNA lysidine(34) synthetase TilS [Myxococcota bacterium]